MSLSVYAVFRVEKSGFPGKEKEVRRDDKKAGLSPGSFDYLLIEVDGKPENRVFLISYAYHCRAKPEPRCRLT